MKLPPKPESVSHVTDAHWEAALVLIVLAMAGMNGGAV
jgi:hypothetical protein